MRPFDMLRDEASCWRYIPGRDAGPVGDHKTAYHHRVRAIPLTAQAQAQAILEPRIADPESMDFVFTPCDLRRTAATRVRAALSREDARLLLGHVSADTTDIYLLDEVRETIKIARRLDAVGDAGDAK